MGPERSRQDARWMIIHEWPPFKNGLNGDQPRVH